MIACSNCLITENNYPSIQLNELGICDTCVVNMQQIAQSKLHHTPEFLKQQLARIRSSKKGKYDCLIGISGGGDSTALVHLAKEWGLNPLLLHIDGGWNSSIAVENIHQLVKHSGFDYETVVIDWPEMRSIQRSFIQANVLDIDLPFDNAMLAYNYSIAKKFNIRYILNGYCMQTEGIMPEGFTHYKLDKRNIKDVYRKMTGNRVRNVRFIGTFEYFYHHKVRKVEFLYPLNWVNISREELRSIIRERYNWKDYGSKHYDNVFTRFYQGSILPRKFGIDKRISHLSMLICSGQLTRDQAQDLLGRTPLYEGEQEMLDQQFFLKKLGLTEQEFSTYMNTPAISHRTFKSDLDYYDRFKGVYRKLKKVFGFKFFED